MILLKRINTILRDRITKRLACDVVAFQRLFRLNGYLVRAVEIFADPCNSAAVDADSTLNFLFQHDAFTHASVRRADAREVVHVRIPPISRTEYDDGYQERDDPPFSLLR